MSKDYLDIWESCLRIIKDNIKSISFNTWFKPIVPLKFENNTLTIQVPSPFFYEYLEEEFVDLLKKSLKAVVGEDVKLIYKVIVKNGDLEDSKPYTVKIPTNSSTKLKNKPVSIPSTNDAPKNPFIIPGIKKIHIDPQLRSELSFENFVEGDCNRLARSAGYAIAVNPGKTTFNPLFLYSKNGLGKTHLAQAIGVKIKEDFPDKIVLYVASNKFILQYTQAVRQNEINDFIHFYQMIDVLIIDDVQDFAGKEGSQNVFFHIFNHLHQSGKQLILTSDKPPVELQGLEQRLLSRFKWGLSAELLAPGYETKIKILKLKIYKDGIDIKDEILEYLASHITTNVRELEGALISLLAQSTLNKKEITLDLAKQMIDKLVKSTKREISIDYIQKVVCDYFNMQVDLLKSKTRKREIVQARQIAMFFAKSLTKSSLATIGSQIGNKDHATVLHACKTVNNLIDTDKAFKVYINDIEKKLKM